MITKNTSLYLFLLVFVLILPLFVGCNGDNAGYEKATVIKGSMTFSFEYPNSLKDTDNSIKNRFIYEFIRLGDSIDTKIDGKTHTRKSLRVGIWDITSSIFDAKTKIDREVEILTAGNYLIQQVEILERSNTLISGISGELLHFNAVFPDETSTSENHLMSSRSLAFVYEGYIWVIDYNTYVELENEASVEFEHIVKSFKFLE
jgi:hypothetical protein